MAPKRLVLSSQLPECQWPEYAEFLNPLKALVNLNSEPSNRIMMRAWLPVLSALQVRHLEALGSHWVLYILLTEPHKAS